MLPLDLEGREAVAGILAGGYADSLTAGATDRLRPSRLETAGDHLRRVRPRDDWRAWQGAGVDHQPAHLDNALSVLPPVPSAGKENSDPARTGNTG